MSKDPYSGYNPNPENPDNTPPPPPPIPNTPPQTYYGEQTPLPYSAPPQSGYGMPPQQGYDTNQPGGYGYETSSPLPLKQAISQLPNQYIRVLTKPSSLTFAAEMGKANWDILWIQLIGYAIIAAILGYLRAITVGTIGTIATNNSSSAAYGHIYSTIQSLAAGASFSSILIIPISFFIGQGITYLIAKAFGGTGTFLRQGYTYLLIIVPIGIISAVLNFIPIVGGLLAFGLSIYAIVLQIFSLMPVHRLSGGKATAVVLIPLAIVAILAIVAVVILIFVIAASVRPTLH